MQHADRHGVRIDLKPNAKGDRHLTNRHRLEMMVWLRDNVGRGNWSYSFVEHMPDQKYFEVFFDELTYATYFKLVWHE